MKITETNNYRQSVHTQRQNPSFGYLKIAQGQVFKPGLFSKKAISVDICILQPEDTEFMRTLFKKWKRTTECGRKLIGQFLKLPRFHSQMNNNPHHFFIVMPSKVPNKTAETGLFARIKKFFVKSIPENEPLCMAMVEQTGANYDLRAIQTASDILKLDRGSRISGSGQMAMYGISKFIKAMGGKQLEISSPNNRFCEKFFNSGKTGIYTFRLTSESLEQFIKSTQKKYNLQDESLGLLQEIIEKIKIN